MRLPIPFPNHNPDRFICEVYSFPRFPDLMDLIIRARPIGQRLPGGDLYLFFYHVVFFSLPTSWLGTVFFKEDSQTTVSFIRHNELKPSGISEFDDDDALTVYTLYSLVPIDKPGAPVRILCAGSESEWTMSPPDME